MKKIILPFTCLLALQLSAQRKMRQIEKNKMIVKWEIIGEHIYFEMEAPMRGWVTIGFNEDDNLSNAYLLMGRVKNGKPDVVEHFTSSPGNYQPISHYNIPKQVKDIAGYEAGNHTALTFSIPVAAASKYHKTLATKSTWTLIMAYSQDDDFQHHSMMRTSIKIKL